MSGINTMGSITGPDELRPVPYFGVEGRSLHIEQRTKCPRRSQTRAFLLPPEAGFRTRAKR